MDPKSNGECPYKGREKGRFEAQTHWRVPCEDGSKDGSDALTSKGLPGIASGERQDAFSPRAS